MGSPLQEMRSIFLPVKSRRADSEKTWKARLQSYAYLYLSYESA